VTLTRTLTSGDMDYCDDTTDYGDCTGPTCPPSCVYSGWSASGDCIYSTCNSVGNQVSARACVCVISRSLTVSRVFVDVHAHIVG
jgi:hypothetical protein